MDETTHTMEYKGLTGEIMWNEEAGCWMGRTFGPSLGFLGNSIEEAEENFRRVIDFYLDEVNRGKEEVLVYEDYMVKVKWKDGCWKGRIKGRNFTNTTIEGEDMEAVEVAFQDAVDFYMATGKKGVKHDTMGNQRPAGTA